MFISSTVRDAVNDATTDMGDRADRAFRDGIDRLDAQIEEFKTNILDQIEIGTYFVAGAIVAGFIAAALILRTAAGS